MTSFDSSQSPLDLAENMLDAIAAKEKTLQGKEASAGMLEQYLTQRTQFLKQILDLGLAGFNSWKATATRLTETLDSITTPNRVTQETRHACNFLEIFDVMDYIEISTEGKTTFSPTSPKPETAIILGPVHYDQPLPESEKEHAFQDILQQHKNFLIYTNTIAEAHLALQYAENRFPPKVNIIVRVQPTLFAKQHKGDIVDGKYVLKYSWSNPSGLAGSELL